MKSSSISTREKILVAATKLFTEKGFSGTSISDIAKEALINQSLLYHHVGNKEELWKLVKSSLLEEENESPSCIPATESLDAFLDHVIQTRIRLYEKDPRILRLIQWQMLEDPEKDLKGCSSFAPSAWVKAIRELQDRGQVTGSYPADLLALYVYSLIQGFLMDPFGLFAASHENRKVWLGMIRQGCMAFLAPGSMKKE